jgi:ABC-2 type transport system permease protein
MGQLVGLVAARGRMIRHGAIEFFTGSKLRAGVVLGLIAFFWLLMFTMFLDGFMFLRSWPAIIDIVLDYLFAFFFVSLLVMMTISNGIIAYTSLYRSEETAFLSALPIRPENTFVYRGADSMVFSSWGMATLVVPMIVAYGVVFPTPLYFYPIALALAALFILFATELGAFFALLVALVLPRRKKAALAALAAIAVGLGVLWVLPVWIERPTNLFNQQVIGTIMDRIAFCQHWALPSRWVSEGMLSAARGRPREAGFLVLMLLANVAFLGMVTHRFGYHVYRHTWSVVQGASSNRRYAAVGALDKALRSMLVFLPHRLRLLVIKDVKTFLRDPSQWSQFLLFFGLLALYIVNLPHFGLEMLKPYWRSLISNLNLCATSLTLATLTSRFVFPQLSLEGRRIWVTGLLPMHRNVILWGKFLFTAAGTFLVSGSLIALSDVVIGLPVWTLLAHLLTVACVCLGLNGLAVGLGALYPRLGTDSPSKIVSSFGGTLNLICSICFLVFALAPVVVPLHLYQIGMVRGARAFAYVGGGILLVLVASSLACVIPMVAGSRAFRRMEF